MMQQAFIGGRRLSFRPWGRYTVVGWIADEFW